MLLGSSAAACRAARRRQQRSRIAHSASVTDDEYTAQPCPPAAWGGHDGHGEIGDDGIVGSWSGRPEIARLLGINRTSGVVAMQVATPSPAAEAGIQPGDIVIAFNGQETATAEQLIAALRGTKPGDRVQLTVLRGAKTQEITVILVERAPT